MTVLLRLERMRSFLWIFTGSVVETDWNSDVEEEGGQLHDFN